MRLTLISYECSSVSRTFQSVYVRHFAVVDFVWATDFCGEWKLSSQNIRDFSLNSFLMWISITIPVLVALTAYYGRCVDTLILQYGYAVLYSLHVVRIFVDHFYTRFMQNVPDTAWRPTRPAI
jgi:hypothetical protein